MWGVGQGARAHRSAPLGARRPAAGGRGPPRKERRDPNMCLKRLINLPLPSPSHPHPLSPPLQILPQSPSYSHIMTTTLPRPLSTQSDLNPTILSDFDFTV